MAVALLLLVIVGCATKDASHVTAQDTITLHGERLALAIEEIGLCADAFYKEGKITREESDEIINGSIEALKEVEELSNALITAKPEPTQVEKLRAAIREIIAKQARKLINRQQARTST